MFVGDITSKVNGKHVLAILLSAILLLSVTQFGVAQNNNASQTQEGKTSNKDNKAKFESDFFEKLKIMDEDEKQKEKKEGASYKPKEYAVYLWVNEPELLEENPDNLSSIAEVKDKLATVLLRDHKASMVHKAEVLSYVAATLPVTEILKLGDYYYVDLVGDAEREDGEPLGLQDGQLDLVKPRTDKTLPIEPNLDVARSIVNAVNLPNCPDLSPCDGSGVKIAIIDAGMRRDHPALQLGTKITAEVRCQSNMCQQNGDYEGGNHGTANAGIAAAASSAGDFKGIAPGASILNVKSSTAAWPAAINWALNNGAKVMVLAKTSGNCNSDEQFISTDRAVDEAAERGGLVVAAIGNTGGQFVTHGACAFNGLAVGAVNDGNSDVKPDVVMYSLSSAGPTFDGRIKPDLVAPGVLIKTATKCPTQAGSEYSDQDYWNGVTKSCQSTAVGGVTGTSHAAPFVAGAAALLWEKNPTWTPAQVKAALKLAANNALVNFPQIQTTNANLRGAGVLDVAGALNISSLSSTDMANWAYDFNISTYVVKSRDFTNSLGERKINTVQYNFLQEPTSSTLSGGISANNGYFRQDSNPSTPLTFLFSKLSVPSIKINGATKFLTDSNLWAAPRVDIREDVATTYVTYKVDGKKVQLVFTMTKTRANLQVSFYDSLSGITHQLVQYSDYAVDLNTDDKARVCPGGGAYQTETKLTSTSTVFCLRDTTTSFPYLEYRPVKTPTEWILKSHAPTADPQSFYCNPTCDNINPANIVVDYKKGKAGNGGVLTLGPKVNIIWPTGVQTLGLTDIWIYKDAVPDDPQDFNFTSPTLGNFTLDDDDDLPTPSATDDRILFSAEAGSHTITEILPPGWDITDLYCTTEGTSTFIVQGTSVTINFIADGAVECTFENIPAE